MIRAQRFSGSEIRSIVVLRALQLGDMLCVVPFFRAMRKNFPAARIVLVGLPWAKSFVERYAAYIDEFIPFPGHPGLPEIEPDPAALPAFYDSVRVRRFDLAVQLHGSGPIVNAIVEKFGARFSAGFYLTDNDRPSHGFFVKWPDQGHEIRRFLEVLKPLGLPDAGVDLEFPLSDDDIAEFAFLRKKHSVLNRPYACVHPGARLRSRRWFPERFADVADALAVAGLGVVLTGSGQETDLTTRVRERMRSESVDLTGRTSLGGMAAVVKNASLLVSNDTGVSHIAAAVRTPSVIVTLGSDPNRWAPLDRERHRIVMDEIGCRPCAFDLCPIGHPCATAVGSDHVIAAALRQLDFSRRNECVPCAS